MANLQRFVAGEDQELIASVEDAWTTMALVEAAFDRARGRRRRSAAAVTLSRAAWRETSR